MGTRLSIYEYTKATGILLLPAVSPDPNIITDVAPEERWNYEMLEAAERRSSEQQWRSRQWPIIS